MGIKLSLIFLGFLSMVIYKVLYAWCLRYNICSTWFLDIRISTCSKLLSTSHFEYLLSVSTSHQSILFKPKMFINQARTDHRPARAWFLKIDPVRIIGMHVCVCVFVCPRPRLLITSGVMWHDMDLIRLVKQVL